MPLVDVFEKINSEYYQLTSAEKKVADYAVIHQQQTQFMSISELAEEAGVAEATISRFCKRLGYKGYSAFKLAIANATAGRLDRGDAEGAELESDSLEGMCRMVYRSDAEALEVPTLFPAWASGTSYSADERIEYGGTLYRCVQAHTSQEDWTPPATPALWVVVSLEEWPDWVQPLGAHDAYNVGAKVSHNGKRWTSNIDANVWEPGVYGWTEA